MKKFLKQKNKKGFTLVETLIALSIFILTLVAVMSVSSSGLTNINSAKKKMTATFLAQEGIEYIRNIRDTYVLYSGSYSTGWGEFTNKMLSPCGNSIGCFFNDQDLNFNDSNLPITGITIKECTDGICPLLYYNNGKYNSAGTGDPTGFIRTIKVEKITGDIVKVTSVVSWDKSNITLTENLFNWVE